MMDNNLNQLNFYILLINIIKRKIKIVPKKSVQNIESKSDIFIVG